MTAPEQPPFDPEQPLNVAHSGFVFGETADPSAGVVGVGSAPVASGDRVARGPATGGEGPAHFDDRPPAPPLELDLDSEQNRHRRGKDEQPRERSRLRRLARAIGYSVFVGGATTGLTIAMDLISNRNAY